MVTVKNSEKIHNKLSRTKYSITFLVVNNMPFDKQCITICIIII